VSTWEGKTKLPVGVIRAFFAALIGGVSLFLPDFSAVFAQEIPRGETASQAEIISDPITAAERALPLEEGGAAAGPAGTSSIGTVFRMVLSLALAAAAIYGVIFFIKRAGRRAETRDPFLKILASAHLGGNRYAHVVAVGAKAWLLGAAEGGVSLIGEIEDKDILNAMLLEDSRRSAEAPPGGFPRGRLPDFKAILSRLGMPVDSGAPGADNIRKRRERLKRL
jgi:flagellar protein FliO/FliZ